MMKNAGKIIIVNIAITLLLLFAVNLASETVMLVYGLAEQQANADRVDERANLPNYAGDRDTAKRHFQEFDRLVTRFEPYIGWSRKPFEGETIHIDHRGDRVHENARLSARQDGAIAPNLVPSVHFFGGSTVWGTGVPDGETIPALFNRISGIDTFNKGEINFTSRQELDRFINLLTLEGEPINAAVFYDGVNEVLNLCRSENNGEEYGTADGIRQMLEKKTERSPVGRFSQYLDSLFLQGTRSLITLVASKGAIGNNNLDRTMNCDERPEKARKIASTLVDNWETARDLARARGIEFLAILQPVAFFGNPKLDALHLDAGGDNELRKQYEAVYPLVRAKMQERKRDWILDYTNLFDRDEDIYIDFCHVSKNGNLIIAKQIYTDLKKAKN
ncbi:MAG: hypothetical protein SXA11_00370 [Cyanobacteriota bacterium]|nr:hypothetical protein [Cyanobacteriota bacterium]